MHGPSTGRGIRSTEFWLVFAGFLAVLFQRPLGLDVPPDVQTWVIGMLTIYGAGRQGVKAVAENAQKVINVKELKP